MLRTRNKYCSNCLSTQRFLDLGASLVCERCSKRLECTAPMSGPVGVLGEGSDVARMQGRVVAWIDASESRREAV
jgi:hypothetical protein